MTDKRNLSRRGFLGTSGLAGAGLWLGVNPLAAQSVPASPAGKQFKIGLIGCGNRSKALISALNSVPELEIAALCDIVPHKTRQRAQLIKTGDRPVYLTHLDELLRLDALDAIVVVTPNDTHREIVISALEAGKHVFCEKPLALTVADCNEIIGVVDRTRRALQIGHQRRHSGEYKALIEAIRSRPVGKILQSSLYDYRGDWRVPEADEYPEGTAYWRLSQQRSGGVVYEMGAHIIDVNNWVFDSEPVSVVSLQGVNNFSLRRRDSADHAGVLVYYSGGSLLNYGGNLYNYGSTALDTFFGVNGTVQMGNGSLSIRYGSPAGFPRPADLPPPEEISLKAGNREGDGVVEQFRYFARVLDGKEKPYPDAHISRRTVQIMEASVRSARERRVVEVRELG
ncbi:MAG: Gfo/Idh/MocA family oxidoreductase [Tannerella sp.]|jgi:predicted dehydrogenase|nr:Gfo/Idh/MocA family oxidoreductase [Tannerella sp.]